MGYKSKFIFILFFSFVCTSYSQNWRSDYNKAWQVLSKKDSAFFYMENAKRIAKTNNIAEGIIYSDQGLMYISGYHYDLEKLETYLYDFKNDLKTIDDVALKTYGRSIYLLENINYNYKLGVFPFAQQYVDSLFIHIKTIPKTETETRLEFYDKAAKYQASIYKRQGQFEQAKETYRRLLSHLEKNITDQEKLLEKQFSINRLLSQTYAAAGNLNKAIELEQVLLNDKNFDRNYSNKNAGISLALNHITHLIEANRFLEAEQELKIIDRLKGLNTKFRIIDLENRAKLNFGLKNSKKAFLYIDNAIKASLAYRKSKLHPDVIQLELLRADFLNQTNNNEEAFKTYQKLFYELETDNDNLTFINKRLKIKLLKGILTNKFNSQLPVKEVRFLSNSLIKNIDFLKPEFENAKDKQVLIENTFETIQHAFSLNANNYLKNKTQQDITIAFKLSEKFRAINLRQNFTISEKNIPNEVDKEILEKEKKWRSQINYLQNAILKKPNLKDELFDLNFNYNALKSNLKHTAPKFYNAKYGNEVNTILEAQKHLKKDQAFVDYFFGIDALYVTLIKTSSVKLYKINWSSEDENLLNSVLNSISSPNFRKNNTTTVQKLSDKILKPFANELPNRLVVVPDGKIHHLPFEILNYENDILVKHAAVSYAESVSLFLQNELFDQEDTVIEAFAPFTLTENSSNLTEGYSVLNWANKEFEFPLKELNTNLYLGKKASLSRFRKSVENASPLNLNIYHIASHAAMGNATTNDGYIVFNGKKTEKLYAQDVYELQLNQSFIILSACETGIGEIVKGQGMRSFSQAFRYAGAKSLLHTKWKVSDQFSSVILNNFYKELVSGKPKDIALQQAKLNYLKQAPDAQSKNAYYWAGYILSGNLDTIPTQKNNYVMFIFLGFLFLITFFAYFFFKRSTN